MDTIHQLSPMRLLGHVVFPTSLFLLVDPPCGKRELYIMKYMMGSSLAFTCPTVACMRGALHQLMTTYQLEMSINDDLFTKKMVGT